MHQFVRRALIAGLTVAWLGAGAEAQTMREHVKPDLARALASGNSFVAVSAASGKPTISPGSIASLFGPNLATQTVSALSPYPLSLGGVAVQVVDSGGTARSAELLYVSPQQINFVVPTASLPGRTSLNVLPTAGDVLSGVAQVETVAPAIFTANDNGVGVVAATAYRTILPTTIAAPVDVFKCGITPGSCESVPIDPGIDTPVTVTLYLTGIRGRSSDSAVTLSIGGKKVPISSIASSDDAGALAGIDQVVFGGILSLRGSGEVDVVVTVDGIASNTGRINIR